MSAQMRGFPPPDRRVATPANDSLRTLLDPEGEDVERARREGASPLEIHDTVLIPAAFCMYDRLWIAFIAGSRAMRYVCPNGPATGRSWLSEIVEDNVLAAVRSRKNHASGIRTSKRAVPGRHALGRCENSTEWLNKSPID